MKREFLHDDFEDFLKRSADSLRMKAPDKVWQNISRDLGGRRRRLLAGLGAFLLLTSAAGYFIASKPAESGVSATLQTNRQTSPASSATSSDKTITQAVSSPATPAIVVQLNPARQRSAASGSKRTELINPVPVVPLFSQQKEASEQQLVVEEPLTEDAPESSFIPTTVDSYTEFDDQVSGEEDNTLRQEKTTAEVLPYSIESVINSFKNRNGKSRFETQLYFTPTISYRKLTENKSYLRSLGPSAVPASYPGLTGSVNSNVTHKPDVGFELGFGAKYAVSNKVKLRTGVQFNVNRYDVKAFSSGLSQTTIALNNGSRVDSLNTYSRYSNVGGYKSNWLQNLSFQLSVPVGVEYLFASADDLQFGVAGTVQPTYVLGDRAYLITTDYKNYTQVPWLIRRWNVNTSFEAFVNYKRWQFGPQVRYQLLSSFVSKYPVKENLFDFGLKIGIPLSK